MLRSTRSLTVDFVVRLSLSILFVVTIRVQFRPHSQSGYLFYVSRALLNTARCHAWQRSSSFLHNLYTWWLPVGAKHVLFVYQDEKNAIQLWILLHWRSCTWTVRSESVNIYNRILKYNILDPVPLGKILTGCEAQVVRGNAFTIPC
jgi:hypothetical protein